MLKALSSFDSIGSALSRANLAQDKQLNNASAC
jgi:hypothetical protein